MKYEKARASIRDGDVFAFRGSRWYSELIKLRTLSRISHVGIAIWVRERLCVMEALEGDGIRIFPVSKCLQDGCVIDWYELFDSDIDRSVVTDEALSHWGKLYAPWWQFVRSWGFLTKWFIKKEVIDVPVDVDPERFFCSEFVLRCLQRGGYMGEGYDTNPAEASPGDVVELPCLHRMGRLEQ